MITLALLCADIVILFLTVRVLLLFLSHRIVSLNCILKLINNEFFFFFFFQNKKNIYIKKKRGGKKKKNMAVATFTAEDFARMEREIEEVSEFPTETYEPPEEEVDMNTVSTVKEVAETLRSPAFQKLLEEISKVTAPGAMIKDTITKDDPEYKLVQDAMKSCVTLQTEIARVHKFIRHKYKKYYKELEQFVVEPIMVCITSKIFNYCFVSFEYNKHFTNTQTVCSYR